VTSFDSDFELIVEPFADAQSLTLSLCLRALFIPSEIVEVFSVHLAWFTENNNKPGGKSLSHLICLKCREHYMRCDCEKGQMCVKTQDVRVEHFRFGCFRGHSWCSVEGKTYCNCGAYAAPMMTCIGDCVQDLNALQIEGMQDIRRRLELNHQRDGNFADGEPVADYLRGLYDWELIWLSQGVTRPEDRMPMVTGTRLAQRFAVEARNPWFFTRVLGELIFRHCPKWNIRKFSDAAAKHQHRIVQGISKRRNRKHENYQDDRFRRGQVQRVDIEVSMDGGHEYEFGYGLDTLKYDEKKVFMRRVFHPGPGYYSPSTQAAKRRQLKSCFNFSVNETEQMRIDGKLDYGEGGTEGKNAYEFRRKDMYILDWRMDIDEDDEIQWSYT